MLRIHYVSVGFAIAVSVLVAFGWTWQPQAVSLSFDDSAPAALVSAEHELIADYLREDTQRRLAADRRADAELAQSRAQAQAEAAAQYADAPAATPKVRVSKVAAVVPATPAQVAMAEPVSLQAPLETVTPPRQRPVLFRVVATVGRLPSLLRSGVEDAAAWVTELPSQALPRLPERRFL